MLPDLSDFVVGASLLGDGRSEVVWVMADRCWVLMRGIREKNPLEFWDIIWVIIMCNKMY